MLSTVLDFSNGKRVPEHYSILVLEAIGFPQEVLPPRARRKYLRNDEVKFHWFVMHIWYRKKYTL